MEVDGNGGGLLERADPLLGGVAIGHALVAIACALWLTEAATPILGVHPASKPLKFGISLALFLATVSLLLPSLSASAATRRALAVVVASASTTEMMAIALQAVRGRRSHFNREQPLDAAIVTVMMIGIACIAGAMLCFALLATARDLRLWRLGITGEGATLVTLAVRAALWLFLTAIVSGAMMGGRSQHTVGAPDGGAGLAVLNWSRDHGDLRVSHFFALHALQILPATALVVSRAPLSHAARMAILVACVAGYAMLILWTLVQAIAARAFV